MVCQMACELRNLRKKLFSAIRHLGEMQAQYEKFIQQYQKMQETHGNINGSRDMGGLARSDYGY